MATDVIISAFGFRGIYLQRDFRNIAVCTAEMFYLQHMSVAVVISFLRALETEISLRVFCRPPSPVVKNGCKNNGYTRVKGGLHVSISARPASKCIPEVRS